VHSASYIRVRGRIEADRPEDFRMKHRILSTLALAGLPLVAGLAIAFAVSHARAGVPVAPVDAHLQARVQAR